MLEYYILFIFEFKSLNNLLEYCVLWCFCFFFFVSGLIVVYQNGLFMNQMLMGLLLNVFLGFKEGDLVGYDMGYELKRMYIEKGNI